MGTNRISLVTNRISIGTNRLFDRMSTKRKFHLNGVRIICTSVFVKMASVIRKCVFNKSWLINYTWVADVGDRRKARCKKASMQKKILTLEIWERHAKSEKHKRNARSSDSLTLPIFLISLRKDASPRPSLKHLLYQTQRTCPSHLPQHVIHVNAHPIVHSELCLLVINMPVTRVCLILFFFLEIKICGLK